MSAQAWIWAFGVRCRSRGIRFLLSTAPEHLILRVQDSTLCSTQPMKTLPVVGSDSDSEGSRRLARFRHLRPRCFRYKGCALSAVVFLFLVYTCSTVRSGQGKMEGKAFSALLFLALEKWTLQVALQGVAPDTSAHDTCRCYAMPDQSIRLSST
jgi:hypothetical protein